jgi:hypothetical protein
MVAILALLLAAGPGAAEGLSVAADSGAPARLPPAPVKTWSVAWQRHLVSPTILEWKARELGGPAVDPVYATRDRMGGEAELEGGLDGDNPCRLAVLGEVEIQQLGGLGPHLPGDGGVGEGRGIEQPIRRRFQCVSGLRETCLDGFRRIRRRPLSQ